MKGKLSKVLIAGMLASTLVLSACASKPAADQPSDTPKEEVKEIKNINLKVMWWGSQERHDATLKALDLYKQQNPGISFTAEYPAWDGYWSKLTVLAASKTMPDVMQMDAMYMPEYVSKGQLADVSDVSLVGIVDQKILDNIKIEGKTYGLPLGHNGQGILYDKTVLEGAGIKLPFKNWTWDDYFAFAEEGRAKLPKGKYAIGDGTSAWDGYQYYQTAYGKGPVFQGTKLNIDKDLWMTYMKKYEEYRKNGIVPPASQSLSFKEGDPQADSMATGVVMTHGASVGQVAAFASLTKDEVDVVNPPCGPNGGGWAQATMFLSIGENSKYKDEGKKFSKWFISDLEAGKILKTTRGIPISEEVYKAVEPELSEKDKWSKRLLDVVVEKAGPFYPAPAGWQDFVTKYKAEMESVMFGKQTIEAAYDKIIKLGAETTAQLEKK